MSSFGDFIALSHTVDESCALQIKKEVSDGIIAPDYTPEALAILEKKKGGKYIILKANQDYVNKNTVEFREMYGMAICQSVNNYKMDLNTLGKIVTGNGNENGNICENALDIDTRENLVISNVTLKYSQSNNVAISYDGQLIGLAAGQQNRVDCVRLAGEKAKLWWCRQHPKVLELMELFKPEIKKQTKTNAIIRYIQNDFTEIEKNNWNTYFEKIPEPLLTNERDSWFQENSSGFLASDGFFPFRDNIDISSKYNVKYIIQPGGSIADPEIISVCHEYGITMIFSGARLFYH
jgi:phosphoribosylaminoimidazolecarboxamide formyltransferase/IMP cyclohydrolase